MRRRCTRCQTVYEGDARFCPRDGNPLVDVADGAPAKKSGGDPNESGTLVRAAVKRAQGPRSGDAATLKNQIIDGRYQVLRRLGEGGMAYVYEARELSTGTSVAVKVLTPKLLADDTALQRLRREAGLRLRTKAVTTHRTPKCRSSPGLNERFAQQIVSQNQCSSV